MAYLALTFLVVAMIAAILGLGAVAGFPVGLAQVMFFVFLALLVLTLVAPLIRRRYTS